MTKQDVMEASNATLATWADIIDREFKRRHVGMTAIPLQGGNVENGKPLPHVVRVLKKIVALAPADLAKIEALIDGWTPKTPAAAPREDA